MLSALPEMTPSSMATSGLRFLSLVTFLGLNDVDFIADEAEAVVIIRDLAAGLVDETGIVRWIRDNWPRAEGDG
jgi:death-on-curing protein